MSVAIAADFIWHHHYECFNLSLPLAQYVLKGDFTQILFKIDLTF